MEKRTGSFVAKGDDGREYTLYIYTEYARADAQGESPSVTEGTQRLVTSNGDPVNVISSGVYYLPGDGVTIRSDDPKAP